MRRLIFALAVVASFEAGRLVASAPSGAGSGAPPSFAQAGDPCADIVARDPASEAAQQCRVLLQLQQNPGNFVDRVSNRVAQEGLTRIEARVLERAQELNARLTVVLDAIEKRLREANDETEDLLDESDNVLDESEGVADDTEDALDDSEKALDDGEDFEKQLRQRLIELGADLDADDNGNSNGNDNN